jgi:short-subunit dehydrogenase
MTRRSLSGLRVLVTGASSGIGRELVLELARQGSDVVAMARRKEKLDSLVQEASVRGHSVSYFSGDVTDPGLRQAALDFCQEELGGLDCLVNNAGIGAIGPFEQADEERLRRIMEVNFFAPVEFTRAALPMLKRSPHSLIVNVCSVLGHRAVPFKSEYCASKFALHGFSDALRAELARDKIDVLLVSPSTTQSEFFDHVIGDKQKPRGRLGAMTPAKVARRIAWAMRSGRHEIILPLGGRLLVWLDRLCPPLADRLVAWFG